MVKQFRNVHKHVRIALATKGHESRVHVIKANFFAKRYGMALPFKITTA